MEIKRRLKPVEPTIRTGRRFEKMQPDNSVVSLYTERESWVHRLHPFTKLSYILLTAAVVYAAPFRWEYAGLLLFFNLTVAASGKVLKDEFGILWRVLLPLMLFMLPVHGFLHPGNKTALWQGYGLIVYQEGVCFALSTLVKLAVILAASSLFVLSTHHADLILAISHAGKSPSLAYLIGSPLLLLATMRERINTIRAAQSARGLCMKGNIIHRFKGLAPLIFPLVIGSFVDIEQRAIALEVRGFKSKSTKTSLRMLADSKGQRAGRWFMLATAALLIVSSLLR